MTDPSPPANNALAANQNAPPRAGWAKLVLQGLGFLIGIALLAWCVHSALGSPEKRAQMTRVLDAPWWKLGLMLVLSAASVGVDGLFFRAVLRPVRRIGVGTMLGVAGVGAAFSYLPFKASMLFRIVYHTRRNDMSIVDVLAWIAATGVVLLIALAPIAVATVLVPHIGEIGGPGWWSAIIGMIVLGGLAAHVSCRVIHTRGWGVSLLRKLPGKDTLGRALEAITMLADACAVIEGLVLRCIITSLQVARFLIAADIAGVSVSLPQAVIAGGAYNLIQAISPGGVSGFREAGAAAILKFMRGPEIEAVTLTVSAAQAIADLLLGMAGGIGLRVDRLLLSQKPVSSPMSPRDEVRT